MTRVEWTRLEGNDVEAVVSMLLCLENPDATRVRPAKGDQGIDVLVPLPEGGLAVYQVKRHAENLTASNRSKLAASHKKMRESTYLDGRNVRAWYPTMPLDPTTKDLEWMEGLVEDQDWGASWRGLAFIEALVAKHPMVVDYYLHGGRARADDAYSKITDLLRDTLAIGKGGPIDAAGASTTLTTLFSVLDESDPFYLYGLSVDPSPPDMTAPGALPDRTVVAVQRGFPGPPYVTIKVIARSAESVVERPVTFSVVLNIGDDVDLRASWRDFLKFGTPFEAPHGTVSTKADLPGGLGGGYEGGGIAISSVSISLERFEIRFQVVSPDGLVLAECRAHRQEMSQGPEGTGARAVFTSDGGVFSWEWRVDHETQTETGDFKFGSLTGATPDEAQAPLRLLEVAVAPNVIRVSPPYGPAEHGRVFTLPAEGMGVTDHLSYVDALVDIQAHTSERLVVPDLNGVQINLRELGRVAALRRGETLRLPLKTALTAILEPGTAPEPVEGELLVIRTHSPLKITVGSTELDLGWVRTFRVGVRLTSIKRLEEHDEVTIEPTESSHVVAHWVPNPDAADAPDSPDINPAV